MSRDRFTIANMNLCPQVNHPGKIICVGLNYHDSSSSAGYEPPKYPVLFLKPASAIIGHKQPIRIPPVAKEVLYEGELAVVIGENGKHIPEARAFDHVAGFTIANDVGARDLEQRSSQWATGKLLDTFLPLGPKLVPVEQVPDPHRLRIRTYLNGTLVQDGNTSDMIFNIPFLINYVSEFATLETGDVILTGSPKSLGSGPAIQTPMKPGDTVLIEIETLGMLSNPVVAEGR